VDNTGSDFVWISDYCDERFHGLFSSVNVNAGVVLQSTP